MHPHPSIHSELARQRQADLLRDARSYTVHSSDRHRWLPDGFRISLARLFRRPVTATESPTVYTSRTSAA